MLNNTTVHSAQNKPSNAPHCETSETDSVVSGFGQENVLDKNKIKFVNEKHNKAHSRLHSYPTDKIKGISSSTHIKKLLWFTASIMIPMRTGYNCLRTGSTAIKESKGMIDLIKNKATTTLESNELINQLIINDAQLENSDNRHTIAGGILQNLSDSIASLNKTDSEESEFDEDMRSFIKHNAFEKLMLKDYQKAVLFEAHIANHMAMQEISRYADQVDGLEETITELRLEVAKAEAWIEGLENRVTSLTQTLTELLESSKNVHNTSEKICKVLRDIPGIRSITLIKNICASLDKLGEGIDEAENTIGGQTRRTLSSFNDESNKAEWKEKWPRLQHWFDVLTDISNNLDDHPDFISPNLPTEEGQHYLEPIKEYLFLKNITDVLDVNEKESELLADEYMAGMDELLNNKINGLFRNLTEALNGSGDSKNHTDELIQQLRALPEEAKSSASEVVDDIASILENNQWPTDHKLYFLSALGALFSIYAVVQSSRRCNSDGSNRPLLFANSCFNPKYSETDNPSIEANKVAAKNIMDNGAEYFKETVRQMNLSDDIEQQLEDDSDEADKSQTSKEKPLSSITWKTYVKSGAVNTLKGIPEFIKRGDIWALLISSITWHLMNNRTEFLENGATAVDNILIESGELSLNAAEAIYTDRDQQLASAIEMEQTINHASGVYSQHQQDMNEAVHAYNEQFLQTHHEEHPWISDFINSRIDSTIVNRNTDSDIEAEFGAFDLTQGIEWDIHNTTNNNTADATLSPLEQARLHYNHSQNRVADAPGIPKTEMPDGYGVDILIAGLVFLAYVAHKIDAQTTHNETHAKNDNIRTSETLFDRVFTGQQDRGNIRNLAELMGGLQLYYIRTRQNIPVWLKEVLTSSST